MRPDVAERNGREAREVREDARGRLEREVADRHVLEPRVTRVQLLRPEHLEASVVRPAADRVVEGVRVPTVVVGDVVPAAVLCFVVRACAASGRVDHDGVVGDRARREHAAIRELTLGVTAHRATRPLPAGFAPPRLYLRESCLPCWRVEEGADPLGLVEGAVVLVMVPEVWRARVADLTGQVEGASLVAPEVAVSE